MAFEEHPCMVEGCQKAAVSHSWFIKEGRVFRVCEDHLRGIDDFCRFFFGQKAPTLFVPKEAPFWQRVTKITSELSDA